LNENKLLPVFCLLFGATLWGIIWYPYRLVENAGLRGEIATMCAYLVAVTAATVFRPKAWLGLKKAPVILTIMGLAYGACNLFYVLAILEGNVMRVLLLFYLAPLWTVPLARFILKERLTPISFVVLFLAFAGAVIMLWDSSAGIPTLNTPAEWLGLASGICFALGNVTVRRADHCEVMTKSLMALSGVVVASLVALLIKRDIGFHDMEILYSVFPIVFMIGASLLLMNLVHQYGLSHIPATRAIVILLFEIVVAAITAYWLAGEKMQLNEWIGGTVIVAAGLFSGHIKSEEPEKLSH
jgi:drug/metabolite transporter (DMT)-like permease